MRIINILASSLLLLGAVGCGGEKKTTPVVNENPFFWGEWTDNYGLPPFDKIQDSHFLPAIEEGMKLHNQEIAAIVNNRAVPTFDNTIMPYVDAGEFLSRVQGVFSYYTSSDITEERAKLQETISPMTSAHYNTISLNEGLFAKIKEVHSRMDEANLSTEQKRLVTKIFDNFARSGANLSEEKKAIYKELSLRENELTTLYGNNLLKANSAYELVIDNKEDLAGLPAGLVATAAATAESKGQAGKWIFTLSSPSYFPFITYSDKRELREQMFKAYSSRGFGGEFDNEGIVNELVNLRIEKAQLLGFESHAHYVLDKNMAQTPEKVYELLETLWVPAIKTAEKELKDMKELLKADGVKGKFEAWDWWYYANKVKEAKYALEESEIKPYFEINNVRNGVFLLLDKLFGVTFVELPDAPKAHPEMRSYKVLDKDGSVLGAMTMDMHPRSTKRGGAWCSAYRGQSYKDGKRVAPNSLIVCNFTAPVGDEPALLTFDEASTFFHEMGHAIQGLLGDVKINGLKGSSRDFVELPSQILECWAAHPEFMKMYAKHYQTGEAIPDELINKMGESSKFNNGFVMGEFMAAAYLDMDYHTLTKRQNLDASEFEEKSMKKLGLIDEIIPRYRSTYYSHIFSGGYAAGYYGYKWADVLVADAFAAFTETGDIFNPTLADKLRYDILAPWGTTSENDMYLKFRGKEADMKYLMEKTFE